MSEVVISVENLSKQYRLGVIGTGTLSHDLNRWWHKVRGKEDPYLKVGEANDRSVASENPYVWALKDVNFKVKRGEVLGIIGRNGAGKSTLLKLLSRVTSPTTGAIRAKGRIASLLEVGTGFHPELTGRENIFLNGAILGMTRNEIKSKLDEIIEFSGTARYIDTPVKRYSSGMTVRLAFAVAAHLEPEILIVDEVLAVGDAEFQKKAIGKMQDVAQGGERTVLFVSHNMASVKTLCSKGLILANGTLDFMGSIDESINKYKNLSKIVSSDIENRLPIKNKRGLSLTKIFVDTLQLQEEDKLNISIALHSEKIIHNVGIGITVKTLDGGIVTNYGARVNGFIISEFIGNHNLSLSIANISEKLSGGIYLMDIWLVHPGAEKLLNVEDIIRFEVDGKDIYNKGISVNYNQHGIAPLKFEIESIMEKSHG